MVAKFMRRMENDKEVDFDVTKRFVTPEGDLGIELDCEVYQRQRGNFPSETTTDEGFGGDGIDNVLVQDSIQQTIDDESFGEDF